MKLNDLRPADGAKRDPFRKGQGHGSGNGKTAGRGHKGQKARSGGNIRPGFEGGQTPLYRRMPKRGFNNKIFANHYAEINIGSLNCFENGSVVDAAALVEAGIIKNVYDGLSVLGSGKLEKKLTVKAARFSKSAAEKIEGLGGKAEVV
ncbi:MAG: 50S ribosomal protein L15 [Clostridia bacterium]|nr:50S ribosomal protein L15 [Clostridia bacterium]